MLYLDCLSDSLQVAADDSIWHDICSLLYAIVPIPAIFKFTYGIVRNKQLIQEGQAHCHYHHPSNICSRSSIRASLLVLYVMFSNFTCTNRTNS